MEKYTYIHHTLRMYIEEGIIVEINIFRGEKRFHPFTCNKSGNQTKYMESLSGMTLYLGFDVQ